MPKYVIERDVSGAGKLSPAELRSMSQRSCSVLDRLGPGNYIAPDEQVVREHAKQGGFPANRISRVRTIIDPTTAED